MSPNKGHFLEFGTWTNLECFEFSGILGGCLAIAIILLLLSIKYIWFYAIIAGLIFAFVLGMGLVAYNRNMGYLLDEEGNKAIDNYYKDISNPSNSDYGPRNQNQKVYAIRKSKQSRFSLAAAFMTVTLIVTGITMSINNYKPIGSDQYEINRQKKLQINNQSIFEPAITDTPQVINEETVVGQTDPFGCNNPELTPEELTNCGSGKYKGELISGNCYVDPTPVDISITFNETGLVLGNNQAFRKTGINTYVSEINDSMIEFISDGYLWTLNKDNPNCVVKATLIGNRFRYRY